MPTSPPSLCTAHGCGTLVIGGGRCPSCLSQSRRESAARRPNAYDARWARFAKRHLRNHPTCECPKCAALPAWQRPEATDVDHIDGQGPEGPHGYDTNNLMAMSHACHSSKTARRDGGFGRPKANNE